MCLNPERVIERMTDNSRNIQVWTNTGGAMQEKGLMVECGKKS